MRNTIVIEVDQVFLTDFTDKVAGPALIESTEGGVTILFNDIDDLSNYQQSLSSPKAQVMQDQNPADQNNGENTGNEQTPIEDQQDALIAKLNAALGKAVLENQIILDSIKSFANVLFYFIFNAEAHRQDKIAIFDTLVAGIRETTNSWELENAIQDATYELGVFTFNHKLTFYNYAHNQGDFNYDKIKNRLIKDLTVLKLGYN